MKGRPTTRKRSAFGQRLTAARLANGLTQEMLASKLGINRSVVRHYERNVTDPKLGFVLRCCAALNISLGELIGDAVGPKAKSSVGLDRFVKRFLALDPRRQKLALRLATSAVVEVAATKDQTW